MLQLIYGGLPRLALVYIVWLFMYGIVKLVYIMWYNILGRINEQICIRCKGTLQRFTHGITIVQVKFQSIFSSEHHINLNTKLSYAEWFHWKPFLTH